MNNELIAWENDFEPISIGNTVIFWPVADERNYIADVEKTEILIERKG